MRAMLHLGLNAGFGNHDCGSLPISGIDFDRGWLTLPRPKTGIAQRVPLWSETIDALRAALEKRPRPKREAESQLVFLTKQGRSWAKQTSANPISAEFRKLLQRTEVDRKGVKQCLYRPGLGFYSLRHTSRRSAAKPATRLPSTRSWATPTNRWRRSTASGSATSDCGLWWSTYIGGCLGRASEGRENCPTEWRANGSDVL